MAPDSGFALPLLHGGLAATCAGQKVPSSLHSTQGAQYPLMIEYTSNDIGTPNITESIFRSHRILGSQGDDG